MKMKEVDARIEALVQAQMHNDRITGTVGMEAGTTSRLCFDEWENWMDEGAQVELVAICSLINCLTDRFDRVLKSEKLRVASTPVRRGIIKCDLYSVNCDDDYEEGLLTKEQADQVVCMWRPKGTKVTWDVVDQCWTETESDCTIPEEFVEEIKDEVA